ncbi:MAG: amidohydrolase [Bacteroidota bacterium]
MKATFRLLLQIFLLSLLISSCIRNNEADMVFFNGRIITADSAFSIAEAVAISGEHFSGTGSNREILRLAGPHTKKIDLQGKTVLPGLIDAHLHPIWAAESELFEEIPHITTRAELLEYISRQAEAKEKGEWIIHPKFFPTRTFEMTQPILEELDIVAPDNPVFLDGGYGGMINSEAMRISGIGERPDLKGISRDPETGKPNGIIKSSAFFFVQGTLPSRTLSYEKQLDALEAMIARYNQVGLTGITDASLTMEHFRKYLDLKSEGRLSIRVNLTMPAPAFQSREQFLEELGSIGFYSPFGDHWVKISQLKTSLDGGILTGTAYLREPWGEKAGEIYGIDDPGYRGILTLSEEELNSMILAGTGMGWKMTSHVTGGGGVDLLLDAYEAAGREYSLERNRHSIIHGNFYTSGAIKRCARMGIIADMQAAWFYKDADAMKYILGDERIKTFLPARSMIDGGMILNGGSDHMVKFDSYLSTNPYNPFLGMWVLMTRTTERGSVINPSEGITREEALRIYTIHNAFGTFDEAVKGSIEPGKLADMIIINKDFINCPADSIRFITVEKTIVGGEVVHSVTRSKIK